jgi:hypothetical protein
MQTVMLNLSLSGHDPKPTQIHPTQTTEIPQCRTGYPAATMMRYPLDWAHEGLLAGLTSI